MADDFWGDLGVEEFGENSAPSLPPPPPPVPHASSDLPIRSPPCLEYFKDAVEGGENDGGNQNSDDYGEVDSLVDDLLDEFAQDASPNEAPLDPLASEVRDDVTNMSAADAQNEVRRLRQELDLSDQDVEHLVAKAQELEAQIQSMEAELENERAQNRLLEAECATLKKARPAESGDASSELVKAQAQVRALVLAIKRDRAERAESLRALAQERDEEALRADKVEQRLLQLIEQVRKDRSQVEQKIKEAVDAALAKSAVSGSSTYGGGSGAEVIALKQQQAQLIGAVQRLRAENIKLKELGGGNSEREKKLEEACRRLKELLGESRQEVKDREAYWTNQMARVREEVERQRNLFTASNPGASQAATGGGPPSPMTGPGRPPPPPPPPNIKLHYEFKINRTGQAEIIDGETEKPQAKQAMIVGSIVDAIKKGVQLRRLGSPNVSGSSTAKSSAAHSRVGSGGSNLALDETEVLEQMARDLARKKEERESKRTAVKPAVAHGGGELDALLAQLDDLADD